MKIKTLCNINLYLCLIITFIMFFWGCATRALITIDRDYLQQLNQKPIGIIAIVPEKRIELYEPNKYRVLWIETKDNFYTFESIWDPSTILIKNFMKTFQSQFNLTTFPLQEKLEIENFQKLVRECETSFNEAREVTKATSAGSSFLKEWVFSPPHKYLMVKPSDSILSLQKTLGIDYILELSLAGIEVQRHTLISAIGVYVYGRLIRLSDGAVIWLDKGAGSERIDNFDNFSELEQNNLELLRKYYTSAIVNLFDPNKTHLNGYFLQGFHSK